MMKKKLIALTLALGASMASMASASDVDFDPDSKNIAVLYELKKGEKLVSRGSSTTVNGHKLKFQDGRERSYVKEGVREGKEVTLTSGKFTTGFNMAVTPTANGDGKIFLVLQAEQADLTRMERAKKGDLEIEIPRVKKFGITQQRLVKSGEQVEFPLELSEDGYKLLVIATEF